VIRQRYRASLLAQDYPGSFRIVLVDDQSSDATGGLARAAGFRPPDRAERHAAVPAGWTGKLWAMKQGLRPWQRQMSSIMTARRIFIWFHRCRHRPWQ